MIASPENTIYLLGVPIDRHTLGSAADSVVRAAGRGVGGWVVTPNLDILRRAVRDREFRSLYDQTTLRLADGMPLVWASRLQGTPLLERAAGSDLIFSLAERAAAEGVPVFLLGGNPGMADKCAEVLCARFPRLRISGTESPSIGFDRDQEAVSRLVERVRLTNPGIVLVALGCPKQERLIARMRPHLPNAWFIGVGITFSFVAGEVRRAPTWMRGLGLEWIHRLAQEPRRLVRRYVIDGIPFAVYLLAVSGVVGLRLRITGR